MDYENTVSINQDLTFNYSSKIFKEKQIEFNDNQKRSLGFIDTNGFYTNVALLFSDQCPHIIKAARFSGTDKIEFQNREEFSGSILSQMQDAYAYINKYNQLHGKIEGMYRIDNYDYPIEAAREALFNAVIHRDYSYQTSPILLSIFDDHIEITNPGGLLPGFNESDLYNGISALRNSAVAEIFFRLVLIEAYGTGIKRILHAYDPYQVKPEISLSTHAFRIILPNTNTVKNDVTYKINSSTPEVKETALTYATSNYAIAASPRTKQIIDLLEKNGPMSREQLQKELGVSQATAILDVKNLMMQGLIKKVGQGKQTLYKAAKQ